MDRSLPNKQNLHFRQKELSRNGNQPCLVLVSTHIINRNPDPYIIIGKSLMFINKISIQLEPEAPKPLPLDTGVPPSHPVVMQIMPSQKERTRLTSRQNSGRNVLKSWLETSDELDKKPERHNCKAKSKSPRIPSADKYIHDWWMRVISVYRKKPGRLYRAFLAHLARSNIPDIKLGSHNKADPLLRAALFIFILNHLGEVEERKTWVQDIAYHKARAHFIDDKYKEEPQVRKKYALDRLKRYRSALCQTVPSEYLNILFNGGKKGRQAQQREQAKLQL